jgi:predicted ATP-dependent protease
MIRNYLDLILALPWNPAEPAEVDLENSRKVLDSHHYGLEDVKDRIIQHLAVLKLKKEKQGSILLLVGPPGTGKTSLGKSIAEALGRPYIRASLGGVRMKRKSAVIDAPTSARSRAALSPECVRPKLEIPFSSWTKSISCPHPSPAIR